MIVGTEKAPLEVGSSFMSPYNRAEKKTESERSTPARRGCRLHDMSKIFEMILN
jgi:hypothetical protein